MKNNTARASTDGTQDEHGRCASSVMRRTQRIGAVALGLFATITTGTVRGQGMANGTGATDSTLQEIVVTAEKHNSTIQETPISISAISGEQLQAQGISDVKGVIAEVPGISIRSAGPGQTELEARGLASNGGSSPTVGFYLDETPFYPAPITPIGRVVIDPNLFDLNRVEVLRGPQGTLYGSGSMGGTIRLITNKPELDKWAVNIDSSVSYTPAGGINPGFNAMFNVPLVSDAVALRVVFTQQYTGGWINRDVLANFPYPGSPCAGWSGGCVRGNVLAAASSQTITNVNWENLTGGRASLLFKPNDRFSIDAFGMYQTIRSGGYSEYDQPPGSGFETHYQPANIPEPFNDSFGLVGATLAYDLDTAQFTSATSYWHRSEEQTEDSTESMESVLATFFGVHQFVPNGFTENDNTNQISEELRLSSNGSSPLQWVGGAFYSKTDSSYINYQASPEFAYLSAGGHASNPTGIIYQGNNPYRISQYALFGEASYRLFDVWKATLGLRWYDYKTTSDQEQSGILSLTGNASQLFANFQTSSHGYTPKFNLAYLPTDNLTLYATASKGFRPGGINLVIPAGLGCTLTNSSYSPDSIWNYEAGEKARFLNRRITIDSDVYYIRWLNVQQAVSQPCGFSVTANAGDARSYGAELETSAQLTSHLTLSLTGAYTNAKINKVNPTISVADPNLVDGFPILNIPNYTESTALSFAQPLTSTYDFTARISNSYVGSSTDIAYSYQQLHPYDIVDLRLGATSSTWSTYFFVTNLTDTRAELSVNTTSFAWNIPSLTRVATNQPRTFGVEGSFKY